MSLTIEQVRELFTGLEAKFTGLEAQIDRLDSRVNTKFDDLSRKVDRLERTVDAAISKPQPYGRPKTFLGATEFGSVSGGVRKNVG